MEEVMAPKEATKVHARWWWVTGILLLASVGVGCSPASFAWFLIPFMDDKVPPRCKLAKKGEVTVVVYADFAHGQIPMDMEAAAVELADILAEHMKRRFSANKEKVTIVYPPKVRSFLKDQGKGLSDAELGAHFKADYVIGLEIMMLGLREKSNGTFYRGQTEISVRVTDAKAGEGEQLMLSEFYRTAYPRDMPISVDNTSPQQFRTAFINHIGRDLSRWFAAFPKEERLDVEK
jgi:hypothetical protein